jgi:hypothetical protein
MILLNAQAATGDESEKSKAQISNETVICSKLQFYKGDRK